MKYTKITNDNFNQIINPYIEAFNCEPNNDEWTQESANKKWKQVISNPNFEGYMAFDDDNNLVGYIGGVHEVYFLGDTFLIEDFFVVNGYQSKGIGSEILEWFEGYLKNQGVVMTRFFTAKIPQQQGYYEKRQYQSWDEIVMMGKELN